MEKFNHYQRKFLEHFLKHSSKVMQYGFAYLFSHPELIPTMDDNMKKIRTMAQMQKKFPGRKAFYQRMLREAYVNYIVNVTKFGFMYVKCNPEAYGEILQLHKVFNEYEKMRNCEIPEKLAQINRLEVASDDLDWDETFKMINELNRKLNALQMKIESSRYAIPCLLKTSRDQIKIMNENLEQKLRDIEDMKMKRRGKKVPVKCPPSCKVSHENLKKINATLEKDLRELNTKKLQRGQNPKETYVANKPQQKTFIVEKQKKPKHETFVIHKPKSALNDSDNDSSEVMISFEQFENPLQKSKPLKDYKIQQPKNKKPQLRAGTIERNLIIPIHTEDSPKITPQFCFKKSPVTGNMQVDLKLNFDDGIFYQNKLVDGICIENALPFQNFRKKMI